MHVMPLDRRYVNFDPRYINIIYYMPVLGSKIFGPGLYFPHAQKYNLC